MGGCGPTKVRGGGSSVFHILCAMGGLSNFQLILTGAGGGGSSYFILKELLM